MKFERPQFVERWRARGTGGDVMRVEADHRRRVGLLKWLLPVSALALVVAIGWSWMNPANPKFHLDYAPADYRMSGQNEVLNPRFYGTDSRDQRYSVTAEVAMRPADGSDQMFLVKPAADITLAKGEWILVAADQGVYDRRAETLALTGAVSIYFDRGLEVHTESAKVDLAAGTAEGDAAVHGQGPWGLLNATGFRYRHDGQVLHFLGRPTLTLYPNDGAP